MVREGTRCIVEHGIAWRRGARQSVACLSMAWHWILKHCITKHGNAKRGIAQRHRTTPYCMSRYCAGFLG
eukprot:9287797-Pyramimonas_sp.AAC.1